MKFFVDNCLAPRLAKALGAMGVDVQHLRDRFPQHTGDEQWLPVVAADGRCVITGDLRILSTKAQKRILVEHHISAVFLPETFQRLSLWPQLVFLARCWPEIEKALGKVNAPACFKVTANCKVERARLDE